jgi:hypothetical protein
VNILDVVHGTDLGARVSDYDTIILGAEYIYSIVGLLLDGESDKTESARSAGIAVLDDDL